MNSDPTATNLDNKRQQLLLREKLIILLGRLTQMVKIHQDNNELLIKAAKDFVRTVVVLMGGEDHMTIESSRGRFYIQNEKLLYRRETAAMTYAVLTYFEKLDLIGFRFNHGIKNCPQKEIFTFARMLNHAGAETNPFEWLCQNIEKGNFQWVEILLEPEMNIYDISIEKKDKTRKIYAYAYNTVKEVAEKISSRKRTGIRKAVRVVQNLADLVIEDDPILLGLCTIRDYDDYTYIHSVNVAILSMCLGQQIGLSRKSLVRLGICGLFHDLGKVDVAIEIINKPGKLDQTEFKEVQKHSLNSVRQILKLQAFRDLKARIILPPFEHHLKYDLSGYPTVKWEKPISLFGRILAIADVFDALTSPRIYRPTALSPDRALGLLLEGSKRDFDPILLKWFINLLGVYPVGTLLKLENGEMALVVDTPGESNRTRPRVMLVCSDGGGAFRKGEIINLSERDNESGEYRRNIVSSHHPSAVGIQPAEFIT